MRILLVFVVVRGLRELGVRLAFGSTEARYRSLAMSGAALIGTVLLLVVASFAAAVWAASYRRSPCLMNNS